MKQLQLQQQLLQVQQKETLREIKHLYHPHPRIHVHLRSNPVIYHVKYSDVTRVGRVERRRGRAYTYQADADFVHRDWERAMEEYADKHPVSYNRAAIKGAQTTNTLVYNKHHAKGVVTCNMTVPSINKFSQLSH